MRILEVYKDVHPFVTGGIERYVHDLSLYLSGKGHRVTVLVAGDSDGQMENQHFRIMEYPVLLRLLSNPVSPGLGAMLDTIDSDVVHFHVPLPSAVMARLLSNDRTPYVVTYHSDIVRQAFFLPFYGPFLRRFLRMARRVMVTSPRYRDSSQFLRDLENTDVVPIGTDLSRFRPGDGDPEELVLFVGRFRTYKGIRVLLDAWKLFQDRNGRVMRLVMAGGGPMEQEIRSRIVTQGLNVEIVNDPDDEKLLALYRNAWTLVLPSTQRSEAYGMVQVEAMACGVPVVSTDLPTGVPWVNTDGETGLVVPPGDSAALCNALERMSDPVLRYRLSTGALKSAGERFDASLLFRRVEEILDEAAE